MKSAATIRRAERKLRRMVNTTDPTDSRVAQAMEHALRWVRLKSVGWCPMDEEAAEIAKLIRLEFAKHKPGCGKVTQ